MIPLLYVLWGKPLLRSSLFVAAAITDWLDGFIARKQHLVSRFGAFLDPVADKLLVATTLVLLSSECGIRVGAPSALIISREIGVSALREWMSEMGARDVLKVGAAGKVKTATQLVSLAILLLRPESAVGLLLLRVAALATIYSGWQYLRAAYPSLVAGG